MARPKGSINTEKSYETSAELTSDTLLQRPKQESFLPSGTFGLTGMAAEILAALEGPKILAKNMQFYGQTELPGTLGIQKTLNQSKFPGIKIIWTPSAILVEHKDSLGLMGVAGMANFTPA